MTRIRKLTVAAAAVGVIGLPMTGVTTAQAAVPSLEIAVSTRYSDKVAICGYNQYRQYVCSPYFKTPGKGYTKLANWWWQKKNAVTIYGINTDTGGRHEMDCPVSGNRNPFQCDGRSNKEL